MKMILVTLLLLCALPIMGQVLPDDADVVLAGPILVEGEIGVAIGYSKELLGLQIVTLGKFGATVEAEAEVLKLFKLLDRLHIGPVAGGGVDWSDEAGTGGTPTSSYFFGAAGAAITYGITERFGAWGFWKRIITDKENKPNLGIGLFYRL